MHDVERDVANRQPRLLQNQFDAVRDRPHRPLEDAAAIHLQVLATGIQILVRRREPRTTRRSVQHRSATAVRAELIAHQTLMRVALGHQHGARPVTEQWGDLDVERIDDPAVAVAPDHQGHLAVARGDKLGRRRQRVNEARAGGMHVHRGGIDPQHFLHQVGRRRTVIVRRKGANHH